MIRGKEITSGNKESEKKAQLQETGGTHFRNLKKYGGA